MKQIPNIIKQASLKHREDLIVQRDKAAHPWDVQIEEIEAFLVEHGVSFMEEPAPVLQLAAESDSDASITRQIKDMAKKMIVPGVHVTTDEIYSALFSSGVMLPPPTDGKPRAARITRVVSGTGLYKGHKTLGWSLKKESPVGAGLSATTSVKDTL
jgi:hypothetical protein